MKLPKEKQKKSLLDLITAENLQEVNSDKKGLEELTKRFNEVTEFLFATDEVQKVLKEKDQKIADLEVKLKDIEESARAVIDANFIIAEERDKLKQQLAEKEERINWLVEAEFNRKWAKKYVEMRRKEEPMLCLPDSDEVYQRYFEQKDKIAELKKQLRAKIGNLKTTDFIRLCLDCGFMVDAKDKDNQDKISFAVEKLTEIRDYVKNCWSLDTTEGKVRLDIAKKIRLKIEELKGNENE